jgi:RecA/RadA recombinase
MAKKKAEVSVADMLGGMMASARVMSSGNGVYLPVFPPRWLLHTEILPYGSILQFVGKDGSGKSVFGMWMCSQVVRAGGWAFIIDTEFKTSPRVMESMMGADVMATDRVRYQQAGSVNVVEGKGQNKLNEGEMFMVGWQTVASKLIDSILANETLRNVPIAIFLDSILGSADNELIEALDKQEGASAGRSTAGMSRAKAISDWLKVQKGRIAQTNIIFMFSNQLKKEAAVGGAPSGMPPKDTYSGGTEINHSCQAVIKFQKLGKCSTANTTGTEFRLSLMKNSFGPEDRAIKVCMYGDVRRDSEGNALKDEAGYAISKLHWDWDGALLDLLNTYCIAGGKMASVETRDAFPALKVGTGAKLTCNQLDIVDVPIKKFHQMLMDREDNQYYLRMMQHPKLMVSPTPEGGNAVWPDQVVDVDCAVIDSLRDSGVEMEWVPENPGAVVAGSGDHAAD